MTGWQDTYMFAWTTQFVNICAICAIYEVFLRVKSCAFHVIKWKIRVCPHLPQRMAFFNQPFWKCLEISDGFGDLLGKILFSETSHRGAKKNMQWTCRPTTNLHYLFMYVYLLGYIQYIYIYKCYVHIYIIIIHRYWYRYFGSALDISTSWRILWNDRYFAMLPQCSWGWSN